MGKSNTRRLRAHWAKAIPDRPLALQLIKVRPFIYTACRLRQVTSDLVEQAEEPLAILTVTQPANSPRTVHVYDGVFRINSVFSTFCRPPDFKCSCRIRFRGQCFWLVRLLDYEIDCNSDEQPQFSQQLTQLPLTKEAVLDGPSDPVDISLLSTLSEWADFVPAAMESSGSKHKENVETHQLDAVCEMVDLTQPDLAQSGLPERMNISDVKDAPNNPVCVVASKANAAAVRHMISLALKLSGHRIDGIWCIFSWTPRTTSTKMFSSGDRRFCSFYFVAPKKESFTSQQPHELSSTPSIADRTRSFLRSSTAGVVLRSLCYRLRKSYASSMLQKNRTGLRTTKHPGTGTSRPSLCAALIDSFMHDQVPFDDTTVDSIRDVCPETPELQSAPARITVKRKVNHSEMNGINVLTKVVKEIAALNAITLSPSNEEKFRAIEETV
ncbi:hypothetical protein FGIG_06024 [Fasciola gigantica]|uniref:Uncharacterized protein n=1 Tax=Fasciola gigantica TaxID=46835 RepID=A0A504YHQ4_FASGI|nr:hypothetical protein FGIG_06024 [Fasciola gigantica]